MLLTKKVYVGNFCQSVYFDAAKLRIKYHISRLSLHFFTITPELLLFLIVFYSLADTLFIFGPLIGVILIFCILVGDISIFGPPH